MKWAEALRIWNKTKQDVDPTHVWSVPYRGTPEHKDVMNIIIRAKPAAVAARNVERESTAAEQLRAIAEASKVRRDAVAVERRAAMAEMMKAKNEARMAKAMGQLRAVATESAARRATAKAAAAAAPAPKPKAVAAAAGGAGTATGPAVSELPEEIQTKIKDFVGPEDPYKFNLAKLFMVGGKGLALMARANALLIVLSEVAKGKDGDDKTFFRALKTEYGSTNTDAYKDLKMVYPDAKLFKDSAHLYRKDVAVEAPNEQQQKMLENGFKFTTFDFDRRVGSMGNPSGIKLYYTTSKEGLNMRTAAGRAEFASRQAEDAATAADYLKRALKKEFFTYLRERAEGLVKKAKEAIAAGRAASDFVIPATAAKAEFVSPDRFDDVFLKYYGDPAKAAARATAYRDKYPGKRIKFYGRTKLNIVVEE